MKSFFVTVFGRFCKALDETNNCYILICLFYAIDYEQNKANVLFIQSFFQNYRILLVNTSLNDVWPRGQEMHCHLQKWGLCTSPLADIAQGGFGASLMNDQ